MSICRFGEGDVYMFYHVDGGIECCACGLRGGESVRYRESVNAANHLRDHLAAGDAIPPRAMDWVEAVETGREDEWNEEYHRVMREALQKILDEMRARGEEPKPIRVLTPRDLGIPYEPPPYEEDRGATGDGGEAQDEELTDG